MRLGVNIDHIATLRQLRGTPYPSILEAARACERAGAHSITVHLREDRRHIQDADVTLLRKELKIPLNLEMALSPAIERFALKTGPDWVCLVPEKRQEVTTEGGLDLKKTYRKAEKTISNLKKKNIKVSLFIEPSAKVAKLSHELGADAVEFHTGRLCIAMQSGKKGEKKAQAELKRLREASLMARDIGLGVHAGHGIDYENVRPIAGLRDDAGNRLIAELNIGHSIVCQATVAGLEAAVRQMLAAMWAP